MAIQVIPYNQKPSTPTQLFTKATLPYADIINGARHITAALMVNTVPVARYFARTTFSTDTGEVKISWSVLFFRSSARVRIVRIGTVTRNRNAVSYTHLDFIESLHLLQSPRLFFANKILFIYLFIHLVNLFPECYYFLQNIYFSKNTNNFCL